MVAPSRTSKSRSNAATEALARQRNARVVAVKAAQRQLGMDDATYRAMLMGQTGKNSATLLTLPELAQVLDYMHRSGARHPTRDGGRRRVIPAADRAALMTKVHALLSQLSATLAYADAICKRNHWCDRVDFASPALLHKLVGALSRTLRSRSDGATARETSE